MGDNALFSLELVTFEAGSLFREIRTYLFRGSGLKNVVIPAFVEVIDKGAFRGRKIA
jgi:hypothetical protein